MHEFDPKQISEALRELGGLAKEARSFGKHVYPVLKKVPWRSIASWAADGARRIGSQLREEARPARPWPRTLRALRIGYTAFAYLVVLYCGLLTISDVLLLVAVPVSVLKTIAGLVLLAYLASATWLAFVQAEKSYLSLAKPSLT